MLRPGRADRARRTLASGDSAAARGALAGGWGLRHRYTTIPSGLPFVHVLYQYEQDQSEVLMDMLLDVDKQRELIRLWNRMRKAEGPIAEEIRIQILERFAEQGLSEQGSSKEGSSTQGPSKQGFSEQGHAKRAA